MVEVRGRGDLLPLFAQLPGGRLVAGDFDAKRLRLRGC